MTTASNSPARAAERRERVQRCTTIIVKRTQLYLDDDLCQALHAKARSQRATISSLVREAARDRHLGNRQEREAAMQAFVGIRKGLRQLRMP